MNKILLLLFATAVLCHAGNASANETKAELAEKKEDAESDKLAIILLGGIAFIMTIFYLVNGTKDVAAHSWSMISTTVSIFAAVMTFAMVNDILKVAFGLETVEAPNLPTDVNVWNSVLQLFFWWLLTCTVLLLAKASPIRLKGYGTIFGHILGFAAIHLFTHVANLEGFHGKPSMTLAVIGIYLVTIPLVVLPTAGLAKIATKMKVKDIDELHVQCKDTGADFFAMGLSFLICMWIQGVIAAKENTEVAALGQVAVAAGNTAAEERRLSGNGAASHDYKDVRWLAIAGVCFITLGTVITVLHHRLAARRMKMGMDVISTTVALSGAWCLLNAAMWHFHHKYKTATASNIAVAIYFSVVFVLAVLLVHFMITRFGAKKRLMRSFFTAVSLAVGLSWEHLFDGCLESIKEGTESKAGGKWMQIAGSFALILIVTPAWMVYILPQHDDELKAAKIAAQKEAEANGDELGPLPISACCCGGYENEGYESVDEEAN